MKMPEVGLLECQKNYGTEMSIAIKQSDIVRFLFSYDVRLLIFMIGLL